jgi:tetratricopeptide (TPR) repeat protein
MSRTLIAQSASGLVAIALGLAALTPVSAMDSAPTKPKPKVDCTKKANKTKPECQPGLSNPGALSDDELYNAAYWLSRQGDYASSLGLLKQVKNQDVPRILNATGFATRKLGDVDAAFPYYARALALDPNYTRAREYLGEAHLSKGDLASAKVQLSEIGTRCGTSCSGYPELSAQIAAFEAKVTPVKGANG